MDVSPVETVCEADCEGVAACDRLAACDALGEICCEALWDGEDVCEPVMPCERVLL